MIEPAHDPAQITDAVAVAILKRARIDLVDGRGLPPERFVHAKCLSLSDPNNDRAIAGSVPNAFDLSLASAAAHRTASSVSAHGAAAKTRTDCSCACQCVSDAKSTWPASRGRAVANTQCQWWNAGIFGSVNSTACVAPFNTT